MILLWSWEWGQHSASTEESPAFLQGARREGDIVPAGFISQVGEVMTEPQDSWPLIRCEFMSGSY